MSEERERVIRKANSGRKERWEPGLLRETVDR